MADTQAKLGPGITTVGNGDQQTVLVVDTKKAPESPSILCLHATADSTGVKTPYYLWVDSTGDLRIHTAIPTNQDSDGSIVGGQS
jgi:hypothetical protein